MKKFFKCFILLLVLLPSACTQTKLFVQAPKEPPYTPPLKNVNVALVLGGGGSKGIAHLGVLKVFEENNIPIDLIVGCSVGSAVGALYADNPNAEEIKNKLINIKREELLDPSIGDSLQMLVTLKGPIRGYYYQKFLAKNLNTKNIESLKIPFVAVTTDIGTNNLFAIRTGPIVPAVHASSAIPPLFTPVRIYGRTLVDGGVKAPVPVKVAKQYGSKIIIAVDISAPPPKDELGNMLDLTYRAFWIFYYELSRLQAKKADIEIHPNMDGYGTFDDGSKNEELYQAGMDAANKSICDIKRKLEELGIPLKSK
ncbi:patatin-like phospholipase family protein [Holosporaceae bacterium 'Namur']|nr:patatin-like phospholipase family protein [Holosporaceae bacterium 'Namur']